MIGEVAGLDGPGSAARTPSFEVFYRDQWAAMVRLAWLMTGSREVAEDVAQDAFVKVSAKWALVESPVAYLRVAVLNGVRMHARRTSRARSLHHEPVQPVLPPELDETWELLDRLPARQRHALVLRFYADLPYDQIAEALACRVGTAKSLVHRGLARMKEQMER